jgi:SAM-dependent methyltransferase
VAHRWPSGGTHWRSSSHRGQCGGGESEGGKLAPHAGQTQMGIDVHILRCVPAPDADAPASRWRSYRDVDGAADPRALGAYMDDLAAIGAVAAGKARSLELLGLRPGDRCLDVGCGTGPELAALAALVSPGGRVTGVDASQTLVNAARRRRVPGVELVVADAHRLPFDDAAFDACRADRTLQHLSDPDTALTEMARVTRPGGRVVVTEFRWGLVAPGLDRTVTDAVLRGLARPGERSDWIGHRLPDMVAAAGLSETRVITSDHTLHAYDEVAALLNLPGSIPAGERAAAWVRELKTLTAAGEAFAGLIIQHVLAVRR